MLPLPTHQSQRRVRSLFFFFPLAKAGTWVVLAGGKAGRSFGGRRCLASPAAAAVGVPRRACAPSSSGSCRPECARGCARPGCRLCTSPGVRARDGDCAPGGCVCPEAWLCAGPLERPAVSLLTPAARQGKVPSDSSPRNAWIGRASTQLCATRVLVGALGHAPRSRSLLAPRPRPPLRQRLRQPGPTWRLRLGSTTAPGGAA